ncbi:YoaK family protein [Streptomyces sp. SID3343]|uniref:YoaK family protein n=1 Tax=Streptomyces sp. SID3343 TaxID=2690260 RepID=UPI00137107D9|nr:YoaK family protein [Streptomyces sp. SID3343]MYV98579.1 DUF1275 domain-containing protein [Streptomyces sp. SID3343]
MRQTLRDAGRTLVPGTDDPHRPLPPLLVLLTVVTGLVDAVSYLELGRVFVANMTGNVVFLGFAFAGAPGLSVLASFAALGAFLAGAATGGRLGSAFAVRRVRFLAIGVSVQSVLIAAALVVAATGAGIGTARRYAMILLLGLAMGIQNAVARRLAVPDLTTTVLSQTLTGFAADTRFVGGPGSRAGRRLLSALAMAVGAFAGATLVLRTDIVAALVVPLVLLVGIAIFGYAFDRRERREHADQATADRPRPRTA